MAGTMEGLGVPLFGGYTSFQSDGTTAFLTVNSDGTHDFTFTDEGADNFIDVTITDSTAISSGYLQAFHAAISTTGVISGGQVNGFALDLTLSGTPGVEVSGMYIYVAETGTTVVTSLNLNGITVYLEDMGGAPSKRHGFKAYSAGSNVASGTDSADSTFQSMCAGASGTWTSLLGVTGTTPPEYFLTIDSASTSRLFAAYSPSDAATYGLQITVAGARYVIPCVADSCS